MVKARIINTDLFHPLRRRSIRARLLICLGAAGIAALAVQALGQQGQADAWPDTRPDAMPKTKSAPLQVAPAPRQSATPAGLAAGIPPGYRAISLQTTEEIAVAGLIRPGDRVDVQMVLRGESLGVAPAGGGDRSEARTLVRNVLVLAVGVETAPLAAGDGTAARTVTLALPPRDVAAFTLARSLASLYLALRNPAEASDELGETVMLGDLRGRRSRAADASVRKAPTAAPHRTVELVVGGESRTLSVGGGI